MTADRPRSRGAAVGLLAVGAVLAVALLGAPAGAAPPAGSAGDPALGRELYQSSCAGCHGQDGEGTQRGPTLIGVGEASADFYLQTGRMPLAREDEQAEAGPPAFGQADIANLVAYVGSLGGGPAIPAVHPGDLAAGLDLYLQNCAGCHSASGAGYTQVGGRTAPSVLDTPPTQVAEAVRVGPNVMPRFDADTLGDDQLDAVVSYVQELQQLPDRGGADLGRLGPVSETLVGFLGVGLLLVGCRLLGKRAGR